jgi:DNA-binding response OmpR family regulator
MHTDSIKKGRILLGESVRQTASKMKAALENDGYEVDQAVDGVQCLEKARASRPELVVLDILLPKIHGIEVLKELRADPGTASTGVIVCTCEGL